MATGGSVRWLVLLRHAKSAWPHGVPDHERPLSGKGRRNAFATGEWFANEGPPPDLVLVSDAVRTQQTWEIMRACLTPPPQVRVEPALYGADVDTLLDLATQTRDTVRTLLLIGHEPTMSAATLTFAGDHSDVAALERVAHKFPSNGVAVLRFSGPWQSVGAGGAILERFSVPRA